MIPLTLFLFSMGASAGCISVPGDRILARDLAAASPLFSSVEPSLSVGYSPIPGTRRTLSAREIIAFTKRYGVEGHSSDPVASICIERAISPISLESMESALRTALGLSEAHIELPGFEPLRLPPGRLEFTKDGLSCPPDGNPEALCYWRGRVIFGEHRSVSISVKAKVYMDRDVVVATRNLPAPGEIQSEQVRISRIRVRAGDQTRFAATPEMLVGKILCSRVRDGQPIPLSAIRERDDINKGEKVAVRVLDNAAHISFEASAISSGRKGDIISLRNPLNGRTFRALIEDKGKAIVHAGGSA